MIHLKEPYKKRSIRFLEIFQPSGWNLKLYGIAYDRELPRPELIEAAKKLAVEKLPQLSDSVYGVGFLGVHDGRGINFVFLDWWQDENELHHHVFTSSTNHPALLEEVTHTGVSACVWDLRVICFERQAWVDQVLDNPKGPDIKGYLTQRLNEDI